MMVIKMENGNMGNGKEKTTMTQLMKGKNFLNTEIEIQRSNEGKFGKFLVLNIFGKELILNENNLNFNTLWQMFLNGNTKLIVKIQKKKSKNNREYYKIYILKIVNDKQNTNKQNNQEGVKNGN